MSAVVFVVGTVTAFWTESALRHFIQYLFRVLTGERIEFYGKNFHLFSPTFYYLIFAMLIVGLVWTKQKMPGRQVFKFLWIDIITFSLTMTALSLIISTKLVVECTACDDGIRRIHYNDIDYVLIILISLTVTILLSGINQMRRIRRAEHNTSAKRDVA